MPKRYRWKIFAQTVTIAYLHVVLFTMHEKIYDDAVYMMQFLCENSYGLLALNYFHKKVPSQIFGMVLNTPLSC